jgi:predicted  nucleic acid-binding Zn-ribbon protein
VIESHPLLEVQRLDHQARELRARREGLRERAEHAAREAELAALRAQRSEAEARRTALGREEHRAEALVADLEAKARDVETRLYSGKVTALKELEALHHELGECRRRQAEQEEAEFAVMEQEERLGAEIAALDARRDTLEREAAGLRAAIGAAEKEIDAELGGVVEARAAAGALLDAALLASYERLRAAPPLRGRAAVRIANGACDGCHATLPIAFASRLHGLPAGSTVPCPRCGRILVL